MLSTADGYLTLFGDLSEALANTHMGAIVSANNPNQFSQLEFNRSVVKSLNRMARILANVKEKFPEFDILTQKAQAAQAVRLQEAHEIGRDARDARVQSAARSAAEQAAVAKLLKNIRRAEEYKMEEYEEEMEEIEVQERIMKNRKESFITVKKRIKVRT